MTEPVFKQPPESFDGIPNEKTGTVTTASLHIACVVVGAGILALPNSIAWLGWVAGPLAMIIFFGISLMASHMLADCYYVEGIEHGRYHHAVSHILDSRNALAVSILQNVQLVLVAIAYTITGASTVVHIAQLACSYAGKTPEEIDSTGICLGGSTGGTWKVTLMFGALQLAMSQVKNLEEAWFMSAIGTIGSFTYGIISLVLCIAHANNKLGEVGGIPVGCEISSGIVSTADKAFGIINALGAITFAYGFSIILLEIQDTLHQPPSASKQMKKACTISITGAFFFYFMVGITGYSAEGNSVAPLILNSFDSPKWAIVLANVAVFAHMATAYQVFMQAVYNTIESHVKWWQLKRAAGKAGEHPPHGHEHMPPPLPTVSETGVEDSGPSEAIPLSPFDVVADPKKEDPTKVEKTGPSFGFSKQMLGYHRSKLESLEERKSSSLSARITEPQLSAYLHKLHSGEFSSERTATKGGLGVISSRIQSARTSMFKADTGLANEDVPLNEDNYFVSWPWRLVVRSIVVIIITIIAAVLPFFDSFLGLVGTISFFPLTVYMPFACYRKVRPVSQRFSIFLWVVWWAMALVCALTFVGAIRSIAVNASTFKVFGIE